ncbi:trigger factor [Pollutimonas thiosulfatoxidans]|uniref:Trigger factor n=1 Tax=Pollutimonas thiosulfatoxidans TaxID=2028345 RepID=A0A410G9V3_9BURK|nr:trigger factor [Pollutimonas thiosulfatoxidans]MBF6618387.1 trigger factor [Candidimonas sp.]NYT44991.1 trigger factor [Alcaligenaceae bacterium]QAA93092.1 trigger factor [Pollutimonas thiosulfatoxidans]
MQPEVEILSGLERRVDLVVSIADVEKEVQAQLKRVARTAKVQGFRPGKAPLSLIERSHGQGIRYDVINSEVGRSLDEAIGETKLRVAGTPTLEPKVEGVEEGFLAFTATFEVYPEVQVPDLASLKVTRANVQVGDAEVQRTIDILRKQRAEYEAREGREAQDDDRVTLDFVGTIDGVAFDGGTAEKFPFVLGQGRMLPEFETAVRGMKAGESKTFPLSFPEDYGSKEVAGKTAEFKITVTEVAEPVLPVVDAEFAKSLGQAEGDVDKLLADVRSNIEREVKARAQARTKSSIMDALTAACTFDVPKALVENEAQARVTAAREELKQRGVPNAEAMPIPAEAFTEEAERRVRLGLLVSELVQTADLQAKPEQVRTRIEEFAQNYEQPAQVVAYYLSDRQRRAEIEAIVLEDNVVDHVLAKAQVTDEDVAFDELMGTN